MSEISLLIFVHMFCSDFVVRPAMLILAQFIVLPSLRSWAMIRSKNWN